MYKSNLVGIEYIYVLIEDRAFELSVTPGMLNLASHPETIGDGRQVAQSVAEAKFLVQ